MRLRVCILIILAAMAVGLALPAAAAAEPGTLSPEEQLGKSIFFDTDLSLNSNQSCASCHAPDAGWTGPESAINEHGAVYEGSVAGAFGDRKPPSSAYATYAPILYMTKKGDFVGGNFWDGRATGEKLGNPAADQAQGPFLNPKEQAVATPADIVYLVSMATYPTSFATVWGWDPATEINWGDMSQGDYALVDKAYDEIALSIASYEASFESNAFTSKFDAWRAGLVTPTLDELKGFALFMGKGKCGRCHIAVPKGGEPPLFTDYTYDNLGIPKNPENPATIADPNFADPGLGGFLLHRPGYESYAEANWGKFKVPTLRNVDKRTPGLVKAYGHNGYFKSLEQIVHFYNTRDVETWPAPEVAVNVNTSELGDLGLSATEEAQIVAFLKTLSDGYLVP